MKKKQLRTNTREYKKLGSNRKKKQKWRRPRGRHNKLRERKAGHRTKPEIGSKKPKSEQEKILRIFNIADLDCIKKGQEVVLAKIGKKKKIEIGKKAKENGIVIKNLNLGKLQAEFNKKKKTEKKK